VSRAIAVALLLVFACGVVSPLGFADDESGLPACCRRGGKHHCTMQTGAADAAPLSLVPERCPQYPKHATVAGGQFNVPLPLTSTIAFVFSQPAAKVQTEARYRISLTRGWQKRGPPFLS
jgi:hypothetical protein